ncbi:hypothetical protein K1719_012913 [Acacia pycnantha]|nr:hypothetical protein K1719_012913 [Acacia pycnantha]
MYPNIEHIFFSTMPPDSDLFITKENPNEDVSIKPDLQFQNHHSHERSVPNCSKSSAISDLVVLESSTRLENNSTSDLNRQSWFTRRNSSQKEKKKEGGEGYEVAGPLILLSSKENCKLKVEKQEEEEEEEEDGFKTPSSLDHRIPEVEQCPPAPIKPKPPLKRKALHKQNSTPLCVSSKDLQLWFTVQDNPLSDSHRIIKKVRRDDSKH